MNLSSITPENFGSIMQSMIRFGENPKTFLEAPTDPLDARIIESFNSLPNGAQELLLGVGIVSPPQMLGMFTMLGIIAQAEINQEVSELEKLIR